MAAFMEVLDTSIAMVSMVRNEGASLGVAALNTLLARRAQVHQMYLSAHINPLNHATAAALARATQLAQAAGANPGMAREQALAILDSVLQRQSMVMAYLDAFMVFSLMALAVIPVVFLMRRSVTKEASPPAT
jgi:DHA2 family multidrug resistance protein